MSAGLPRRGDGAIDYTCGMATPLPTSPRAVLRAALDGARGLALLRDVLDDAPGRAVLALLSALVAPEPDPAAVAAAYGRAFMDLAAAANADGLDEPSDVWQAHLLARLLDDDNPWSAQAEGARSRGARVTGMRIGSDSAPGMVAPGLLAAARCELATLKRLHDLDAETLWRLAREAVAPSLPALRDAWAPWRGLSPPAYAHNDLDPRAAMARRLAESDDWATLTDDLTAYWAHHGTGLPARYRVLRWAGRVEGLRPVAYPDEARLDGLVEYEREQGLLMSNIERFLAGLPAQHALLYGPPGTGKSSTVKALANHYAPRGLRLVELRKEDTGDLPAIAALARDRAPYLLVYVDDLSFEEHETGYKALKALLEGAAEARPANMLLHATTNRRNLVRETFAERGAPGDDVHGRDTMGEKISLAARFGLRVTFPAPDQERYVAIATALARGRGLAPAQITDDELRRRALLWERGRPGRSGRTARQFVDDLEAELRAL